jgi:hypothetical protein
MTAIVSARIFKIALQRLVATYIVAKISKIKSPEACKQALEQPGNDENVDNF